MSRLTANALKSNNAGRAFQTRMESIFKQYRLQGRADVEKIDPPVKISGTQTFRKVIFLENPWLDYGGTWTEQAGRAIYLEAKTTQGERLGLGTGGVTDNQIKAIRRWDRAGAATGVVWGHGKEIRIIPGRELLDAWDGGARGIQWRHIPPCDRGLGLVEFDILTQLAERDC